MRGNRYGQTGSGKTFTMQGIQKQIAADVFAKVCEFEQMCVHCWT